MASCVRFYVASAFLLFALNADPNPNPTRLLAGAFAMF